MANNRDSGTYTRGTGVNPPTDPAKSITSTASNSAGGTVITYTTGTTAHKLVVGQPVITGGFTPATTPWLNYNPDSGVGNGTPAIVASVPTSTSFTVNTSTITTAASSVSGTVYPSNDVSSSQWTKSWLTTADAATTGAGSISQPRIDRAWGKNNGIQPNDDRLTGTVLSTTTAPVSSGTQVTYTVASHTFVPGQTVTIQGVVPNDYNLDTVTVASTTSTTVVFNSTLTKPVTSFAKGAIVPQYTVGGQQAVVSTAAANAHGAIPVVYTTPTPHNLVVGQSVSVVGSTVANTSYYVKNATITATGSATTFSVSAPVVNVLSGSVNTTYDLVVAPNHGLAVGDTITIKNMTSSARVPNTTSLATISAITTSTSSTNVTVSVPLAAAGITLLSGDTITVATGQNASQIIKNLPAYTASTAYVALGDNGWNSTYAYPSGPLVAGLDSHEVASLASFVAGDNYATLTIPNVVGLYNTSDAPAAIRAFKAAGFTNVIASETTDSVASSQVTGAASNSTIWTYTATAHGLVVGQIVTVTGVGAFNVKNAIISTTATDTFSIANTTSATTLTGQAGAWTAYNGIGISTLSLAGTTVGSIATVTTSVAHGLKVGDYVGIAGATTTSGVTFGYLPGYGDAKYVGTTVATVTSPTVFTYAIPAVAGGSGTVTPTGGKVLAYNGIVTAQSLTAGTTSTTPSTVGTVTVVPGTSAIL